MASGQPNPFDPEEYRKAMAAHALRNRAQRDRDIALLRQVIESRGAEDRDRLVKAFFALDRLQSVISQASGGLLAAPNVVIDPEWPHELVCSNDDVPPLYREVAALKECIYFCPGEVVTADACWRAGEEYAYGGFWWTHPRCPEDIGVKRLWNETAPAGDDERPAP